jgi:hypothetical protein
MADRNLTLNIGDPIGQKSSMHVAIIVGTDGKEIQLHNFTGVERGAVFFSFVLRK